MAYDLAQALPRPRRPGPPAPPVSDADLAYAHAVYLEKVRAWRAAWWAFLQAVSQARFENVPEGDIGDEPGVARTGRELDEAAQEAMIAAEELDRLLRTRGMTLGQYLLYRRRPRLWGRPVGAAGPIRKIQLTPPAWYYGA